MTTPPDGLAGLGHRSSAVPRPTTVPPPFDVNPDTMSWRDRLASRLCRRYWRLAYWGALHLVGRYASHRPGLQPQELRALVLTRAFRREVEANGGRPLDPPFSW